MLRWIDQAHIITNNENVKNNSNCHFLHFPIRKGTSLVKTLNHYFKELFYFFRFLPSHLFPEFQRAPCHARHLARTSEAWSHHKVPLPEAAHSRPCAVLTDIFIAGRVLATSFPAVCRRLAPSTGKNDSESKNSQYDKKSLSPGHTHDVPAEKVAKIPTRPSGRPVMRWEGTKKRSRLGCSAAHYKSRHLFCS